MTSYLADIIRKVAAAPTRRALAQLAAVADQVERMERCLDDIVAAGQIELITTRPERHQ